MNDSLFITIYIALILSGVMAVFLIAIQIAIFILLQKSDLDFGKYLLKVKNYFLHKINTLSNFTSKISKTERI